MSKTYRFHAESEIRMISRDYNETKHFVDGIRRRNDRRRMKRQSSKLARIGAKDFIRAEMDED